MTFLASRIIVAAAVAVCALGALVDAASASDWRVNCDDDKRCVMQTAVKSGDKITALLTMSRHAEGGLVGEIVLPLFLHFPSGVAAQVDDGAARLRPRLLSCNRRGCYAFFRADGRSLQALRDGLLLRARAIDIRTGKPAEFAFSLKGFTKAHESLK